MSQETLKIATKKQVVKFTGNVKSSSDIKSNIKIEHPMYNFIIQSYPQNFVITDKLKTDIIQRVENLKIRDKETIFLLIMTHYYRHPNKEQDSLPYGGRQLKTKPCLTFEFEKMPDQVVYIIYKFLDIVDKNKEDDIDTDEFLSINVEYTKSDMDYVSIN